MNTSVSAKLEDTIDIDLLPIPQAGPGRKAKEVTAVYSRDLQVADLTMAATAPVKAPALAKIRDSHHALARVLASGASEGDASIITGYSPGRISVLKADPQFKELLAFYRSTATDVIADFRQRMADLGMDALNELRDRLEEKPEDFSPGLLKDIVRDLADRTGHAPQRGPTTVNNLQINLTEQMAKARERVAALQGPKVIDQ